MPSIRGSNLWDPAVLAQRELFCFSVTIIWWTNSVALDAVDDLAGFTTWIRRIEDKARLWCIWDCLVKQADSTDEELDSYILEIREKILVVFEATKGNAALPKVRITSSGTQIAGTPSDPEPATLRRSGRLQVPQTPVAVPPSDGSGSQPAAAPTPPPYSYTLDNVSSPFTEGFLEERLLFMLLIKATLNPEGPIWQFFDEYDTVDDDGKPNPRPMEALNALRTSIRGDDDPDTKSNIRDAWYNLRYIVDPTESASQFLFRIAKAKREYGAIAKTPVTHQETWETISRSIRLCHAPDVIAMYADVVK